LSEFRKFKLFIAVLGILFLVACGKSDDAGSGGTGGSGDDEGDTIKIGLNFELSGSVSSYGTSGKEGAELAVEQINAEGGINGKKLELVPVDNKSDNSESTNVALKLITQDNVVAIIGPATTGAVMAEIEVATQYKVPVITPSGTNARITVNEDGSLNEYIFRTCFIDPFQGEIAATFAIEELGLKNAAIYYDNSSDYAKGLGAAFKETFTKKGGTIVAEEAYAAGDTDFNSTLTSIKSANPDVVFVPGYYEEVGLIIKQARELGIEAAFIGGDGWDSPDLVKLAGEEALNNAYMIAHYSSDDPDPRIKNFVGAFKEKYGKEPNGFHALGYDSVLFLADALKRAGSTDGEKIKDALQQTKNLELVSGTFSVDPKTNNPIKAATILEFENGTAKFKSKVTP
jgi:amino acid/amide ABC transporter substrate-binding protein, HAAT family (TC 3.A.1.4.-)